MKEFTSALQLSFMVNKRNIVKYFCIVAVSGVVGILMAIFLAYQDASGRIYVSTGATATLIGGVLTLVILGGVELLPLDFNLSVAMGRARKNYALTRYLIGLVCVAGTLGIALLMGGLENMLCPILFLGRFVFGNVDEVIGDPLIFLGVFLLVPAVLLFMSAMMLRFANTFVVLFFGGIMLICALSSKISGAIESEADSWLGKIGRGIVELFTKSPTVAMILGAGVVGVICMVIAVRVLRKQRVTL